MEKDLPALLFDYQDHSYAALQKTLIPGISEDRLIGVRTPQLRKIAKEMIRNGESEAFLQRLPHHYFEENQLHAFILSEEKDFARSVGKMVEIKTYKPIDRAKEFTGILISYDEDTVTIRENVSQSIEKQDEAKDRIFAKKDIALIRLAIMF